MDVTVEWDFSGNVLDSIKGISVLVFVSVRKTTVDAFAVVEVELGGNPSSVSTSVALGGNPCPVSVVVDDEGKIVITDGCSVIVRGSRTDERYGPRWYWCTATVGPTNPARKAGDIIGEVVI